MPITTDVSEDDATVTIRVTGRFDFSAHADFQRAYTEFPRGEKHYVIDMKGADYMDSSAMGMLLQLRDYGDKGARWRSSTAVKGFREIWERPISINCSTSPDNVMNAGAKVLPHRLRELTLPGQPCLIALQINQGCSSCNFCP